MKKIKHLVICNKRTLLFSLILILSAAGAFAASREFYELRIYHLKDKSQEEIVDKYLQNAFLPALHKAGIKKAGVFKPVGNDTSSDRRIFVFIPLNSLNQAVNLSERLEKDKSLEVAGADYVNAAYNNAPYLRMEVIHIQAFPDMPRMMAPSLKGPMSERIYELRSYEGATEKLHINKVKMFNEGGEVKLFKRLGFNAVFYGRVVSGSTMPNLMYMTTFENKASRDEHWKAFSADPEWKKLSAMPEYKNNVSKNVTLFLRPAEYSDI